MIFNNNSFSDDSSLFFSFPSLPGWTASVNSLGTQGMPNASAALGGLAQALLLPQASDQTELNRFGDISSVTDKDPKDMSASDLAQAYIDSARRHNTMKKAYLNAADYINNVNNIQSSQLWQSMHRAMIQYGKVMNKESVKRANLGSLYSAKSGLSADSIFF